MRTPPCLVRRRGRLDLVQVPLPSAHAAGGLGEDRLDGVLLTPVGLSQREAVQRHRVRSLRAADIQARGLDDLVQERQEPMVQDRGGVAVERLIVAREVGDQTRPAGRVIGVGVEQSLHFLRQSALLAGQLKIVDVAGIAQRTVRRVADRADEFDSARIVERTEVGRDGMFEERRDGSPDRSFAGRSAIAAQMRQTGTPLGDVQGQDRTEALLGDEHVHLFDAAGRPLLLAVGFSHQTAEVQSALGPAETELSTPAVVADQMAAGDRESQRNDGVHGQRGNDVRDTDIREIFERAGGHVGETQHVDEGRNREDRGGLVGHELVRDVVARLTQADQDVQVRTSRDAMRAERFDEVPNSVRIGLGDIDRVGGQLADAELLVLRQSADRDAGQNMMRHLARPGVHVRRDQDGVQDLDVRPTLAKDLDGHVLVVRQRGEVGERVLEHVAEHEDERITLRDHRVGAVRRLEPEDLDVAERVVRAGELLDLLQVALDVVIERGHNAEAADDGHNRDLVVPDDLRTRSISAADGRAGSRVSGAGLRGQSFFTHIARNRHFLPHFFLVRHDKYLERIRARLWIHKCNIYLIRTRNFGNLSTWEVMMNMFPCSQLFL